MNKKRTAADQLLPLRSAKQPRTAFTRPDGSKASPTEPDGLRSRWISAFGSLWEVSRDTVTHFLASKEERVRRRATTAPTRSRPRHISVPRQYQYQRKSSSRTSSGSPQPPPESTPSPPDFNFARAASELPAAAVAESPSPIVFRRPTNDPPLLATPRNNFRKQNQTRTPRRNMPPPPTPPPKISTEIFPPSRPPASPAPSSSAFSITTEGGTRRNYRSRDHIYKDRHKRQVKERQKKDRDDLLKELYNVKRQTGYRSDLATFQGFLSYREKLERDQKRRMTGYAQNLTASSSLIDLRAFSAAQDRVVDRERRHSTPEISTAFLQSALDKAKATLLGPKPPKPFSPSLDQLYLRTIKSKDERIEQTLRPKRPPLPSYLPPEAENTVNVFMKKKGVIGSFARESVSDKDIWRLGPGQWLNDEIINFWGAMLVGRSDAQEQHGGAGKENGVPNGMVNGRGGGVGGGGWKRNKPLNAHYFTTFFWTKLDKEGYERGRLAKWTKKVDLFTKDVVLIPINHSNTHWTGAAINFKKKRIESYDSMLMERPQVQKRLREYLDAEHRNKKKKPFDFTGWVDYTPMEITPCQENGYDCGVFTCQFLESLSRGEEEFGFTQEDIPYLRRRMVWEIGNAKFWED